MDEPRGVFSVSGEKSAFRQEVVRIRSSGHGGAPTGENDTTLAMRPLMSN